MKLIIAFQKIIYKRICELLPQVIEMVIEAGQASVSLVQRRFKIGYTELQE